jgi:hypothetical protein
LPAVGFPHLAPAGYRRVPAQDNGGRLQENAPAVGQPRDAQASSHVRWLPISRRNGAELVVRFNLILSAAIGFVTALMLTTCASPSRVVWEYYDQCARENPSFLAMAECGRQKRLAECVPNNTCSPEGNMFMQYVDTLVVLVKKKELTEAEAIRRYTEYKAGGTPSHP